jgi:hypothetical protein
MSVDTFRAESLDRAAGRLQAAADRAEQLAGNDTFSEWHDLASQARLIAAGLSNTPLLPPEPAASTTSAVASALATLNAIPGNAGTPDLLLWAWHVRELRDLAAAMEQR